MKCQCSNASGGRVVFCDLHAIEHRKRLMVVAEDLVLAGDRMEVMLRAANASYFPEAQRQMVRETIEGWMEAIKRAKEACGG